MSDISVLQAPGPGQVAAAKPANNTSAEAPSPPNAQIAPPADFKTQYASPRLEIDPLLNQVILAFRNGQTGVSEFQVPSKSQLLLYQGTQNQVSAVPAKTGKSDLSS